MTTDAPTNGVSTWIVRAGLAIDVLSKISLTTFLLVIVGVIFAAWFGWISSPMVTGEMIQKHDERVAGMLTVRAGVDEQFLTALREMNLEMKRSNNAYRIRICAEITARDVRQRCLEQ